MAKFDHNFLEEMKSMFNVDLIGVASVTKCGVYLESLRLGG